MRAEGAKGRERVRPGSRAGGGGTSCREREWKKKANLDTDVARKRRRKG